MTARSAIGQSRPVPCSGKILVIRGIFNVFSLGCDSLGRKLSKMGYDVEVVSPSYANVAARMLRDEYVKNPGVAPIVFIGHSRGGRKCLQLSRLLGEHNVPVKLVVIVDSNIKSKVPGNVERCVNMFTTNMPTEMLNGNPVTAERSSTKIVNVNMTKMPRPRGVAVVHHLNIDASDWIHQLIAAEITRVCNPQQADFYANVSNR